MWTKSFPQKNLENLSISSLVSGLHALCFQEMFQATQRHSTSRGGGGQPKIPGKMGNLRAVFYHLPMPPLAKKEGCMKGLQGGPPTRYNLGYNSYN